MNSFRPEVSLETNNHIFPWTKTNLEYLHDIMVIGCSWVRIYILCNINKYIHIKYLLGLGRKVILNAEYSYFIFSS